MAVSQREWARSTDVARGVLVAAALLPPVAHRSLREGLRPALAIGLAAAAAKLIQHLAGRRRPNGQDHHSMPSHHTTEAFAAATAGSALPAPVALGLAGGVAAGRVLAKKHYVSDVLAGAALGTAASLVARWASTRLLRGFEPGRFP